MDKPELECRLRFLDEIISAGGFFLTGHIRNVFEEELKDDLDSLPEPRLDNLRAYREAVRRGDSRRLETFIREGPRRPTDFGGLEKVKDLSASFQGARLSPREWDVCSMLLEHERPDGKKITQVEVAARLGVHRKVVYEAYSNAVRKLKFSRDASRQEGGTPPGCSTEDELIRQIERDPDEN